MGIQVGSAQRIIAISTVKNEADIIEAFVRHTLAFADNLVILDNGSTDGTLGILRALEERCGLPIEIVEDPSPGHWLWRRMTRLMREFAVDKYGADWILCLDADEFIHAKSPMDLRAELFSLSGPASIELRTYVPDYEDSPTELNPVLRMCHRLAEEVQKWSKVIIPRTIAEQENAQLTQGNHSVTVEGKAISMAPIESSILAHFPIRDAQQYASKIALRALQYAAMYEKGHGWSIHLLRHWQTLKEDPQRILDTYRDEAMRYMVLTGDATAIKPLVLEPVAYAGEALTVTICGKTSNRLLKDVLNYSEGLATSYATLRRDYESIVSSRSYRLSLIIRAIWSFIRVNLARLRFRHPRSEISEQPTPASK
ncbi:MAG: glycosyltransferase family 2 protein [Rectinemataceae bacterium]|jgi:glycosyltransferase involved in cell wall biosynthesis